MLRIALTALGTWGDAFPVIAIARELRRRGHSVRLVLTPDLAPVAMAEGLDCTVSPFGLSADALDRAPEAFGEALKGFAGVQAQVTDFIVPMSLAMLPHLRNACADRELVVTTTPTAPGGVVAEALGLPWVSVVVYPGGLPSSLYPPGGYRRTRLPAALGRPLNRILWSRRRRRAEAALDGELNRVRAAAGLPPKTGLHYDALSPHLALVTASELLAPRAPDWPPQVLMTGFTWYDGPDRLAWPAAQVAEFLAEGEPPVVATLGASNRLDPGAFYEVTEEALRRLGLRGLFLVAGPPAGFWDSRTMTGRRRGSLLIVPYAPLSTVLPRARALIQHGGLGTTAAALRAGVPSVVVPRLHDQTYQARRLADLGVGASIPWARLTPGRLVAALRGLEAPEVAERSRELAAKLGAEDGAVLAAQAIEELFDTAAAPAGVAQGG